MSIQYFDMQEKMIKENDERDKRISRRAIYAGVVGFAITAVNSYFTGEPSLETFTTPINQLTNLQLTDASIFSMSSLSYFSGGLMYGLITLIENDSRRERKKRKENELEKELKD